MSSQKSPTLPRSSYREWCLKKYQHNLDCCHCKTDYCSRHLVWMHMGLYKLKDLENVTREWQVECIICDVVIKWWQKINTCNLVVHIEEHFPDYFEPENVDFFDDKGETAKAGDDKVENSKDTRNNHDNISVGTVFEHLFRDLKIE